MYSLFCLHSLFKGKNHAQFLQTLLLQSKGLDKMTVNFQLDGHITIL